MKRNKEIDYLRAYAVTLVLLTHVVSYCYTIAHKVDWTIGLSYNFSVGVDLFFVISGFVVSDSFQRLSEKENKKTLLFSKFYLKRFIRLWPAAVFWLLFNTIASYVLVSYYIYPEPTVVVRKLIYGMFYLSNFDESINSLTSLGYFWSLSVEWQAYLVIPFLFLLKKNIRILILLITIILLSFYRLGGDSWWLFRFDGILFGIIIYDFRALAVKLQNKIPKANLLISTLLTFVLIYLITISFHISQPTYVATTLVCLFSSILVCMALASKGYVSNLSLDKIITWIGLRSYSIYLCHFPAMYCVLAFLAKFNISLPYVPLLLLCLAVCAVFSEFSYRKLESINIKRTTHVQSLTARQCPKKLDSSG